MGKKLFISAAIILICAGLSNCASLIGKKNTYQLDGPAARVNGATVRLQVSPQGAADGAISLNAMVIGSTFATMEGPFKWRIEATGMTGDHQSLILHRIHTSTEKSKRSEWYPATQLPLIAEFKQVREDPNASRARCEIPGLLQVKSHEDGKLRIRAELSISRSVKEKSISQRATLSFLLDPTQKRINETIFLPVEIVRSFGKSLEEADDPSWE